MSCLTLTTDFGHEDWFVGTMKGVILSRHPSAQIVDLNHGVPPGDIRAGTFSLMAGYRHFPEQTIHTAVVDPGVGSDRPAIAVATDNFIFVGPDNGVLSWALRREKIAAIHRLQNTDYFLAEVSQTFHGRDVFAPVAAAVASGIPLARLGPATESITHFPWPDFEIEGNRLHGEVIYVDRFGNAITNLPNTRISLTDGLSAQTPLSAPCPVASCYSAVKPGSVAALPGSSGFLEIAVNGGSAAGQIGLIVGSKVTVER